MIKKYVDSFFYLFGNVPLCNKRANRGFYIKKFCFPICCRCFAIISSLLLCYFVSFLLKKPILDIHVLNLIIVSILLVIPTTIDALIQFFFKKESTNFKRFATGILAGIGLYIFTYIVNLY